MALQNANDQPEGGTSGLDLVRRRRKRLFLKRSTLSLGAVALLLSHCVQRVEQPHVASVTSSVPAKWVLQHSVISSTLTAVRTEAPGTHDLILSNWRVRVTSTSIEWSQDRSLHPMAGVANLGQAWLFATTDGGLFRADTFLGPLVRVGDTHGVALSSTFGKRTGEGVLVALDADGRLWIADETSGFRVVETLDNDVLDAVFFDTNWGVVLTAPRELFRTTDGGATFESLSLGADTAASLERGDGVVFAKTTSGVMRIAKDLAPTRATSAETVEPVRYETGEVETLLVRLRKAVIENSPVAQSWFLANGVQRVNGHDVAVFGKTDEGGCCSTGS